MNISTDNLEGSKVKVTVTVDAKDVDKYIKDTYADLARKYNFPGFRKGKAPRPVIDNALGKEAILATVTEDVINRTYPKVVEEAKLFPVGQPEFDSPETVEPAKDFTFAFTQDIKPEFELTSYDPVEVEVPASGASEAEIDEQVEAFRNHYAGNTEEGESELPEVTDEWAKEVVGFEDVADMRKQIADSITSQKEDIIPRIKENACAAVLVGRFEEEVPETMAEQMESELLQDFFTQLQRQGMTFDDYLVQVGIDNAQFKEDVKKQAEDECKRELALDAWARHAGIEVSDADLLMEFAKAGVEKPQEAMDQWRDAGRLYMIRESLLRSKAMADVIETAKVTEVDFAERAKEENSESDDKADGGKAKKNKNNKKNENDKDDKGSKSDKDE